MRLPPALVPLRHGTFRMLWFASVVVWLGTWLQNTGASWLMTTLAPRPLIVAMVQAATIMPVFLLALAGSTLIARRVIRNLRAAVVPSALHQTALRSRVWPRHHTRQPSI